jgi:hypothetical protein
VIEGGPRRHTKAIADLSHRRGHSMLSAEGADEVQDVSLPAGEVAHAVPPTAKILNAC